MNANKPETRTEAAAPDAAKHLNKGQQAALELGEEAEHATGPAKESLIKKAGRLAKDEKAPAKD